MLEGAMARLSVVAISVLGTSVLWAQNAGTEIRGTVVDGLNHPISEATATLRDKLGKRPEQVAFTDAAGVFHYDGMPPGNYELVIEARGLYSLGLPSLHLTGAPLALRFELEFGFYSCPQPDRLLHYFRQLDPGDSSAALGGTVLNESGAPVSGAIATLYVPSLGRVARTSSNEDGEFSFNHLAVRSDYWIRVVHDGFFAGEFTKLEVQPQFETVYGLELESCEVGHCAPHLKKIRVLPSCE